MRRDVLRLGRDNAKCRQSSCDCSQQSGLRPLQSFPVEVGELCGRHTPVPLDGSLVLRAHLCHDAAELWRAPLDPKAEGGCPQEEERVEVEPDHGHISAGRSSHLLGLRGDGALADQSAGNSVFALGWWPRLRK